MFTHLHVHTEYSMLDGISRIPEMVAQTKNLGMDALAITDHGSLYGVVDFYSECKQAGIKPIIGCEVYVAHGSRRDRTSAERSPHHLVLLARDNTGYQNLMQLVTQAHLEGFHYRPRIDKELLAERSQGLICLSSCPSAEVPRLLADGNIDAAKQAALWYKELFGEGYFLELQAHQHVPQLEEINQGLVSLSRDLDLPLVVTNDSHYVMKEHAPFQDIYICIQTNTTVNDEKRLRMEDDSYYIKSPEEMAVLFPEHPEALENTQRIADMCQVELGFGQTHLPKYGTPDDMDADEYLTQLCWEGFQRRYHRPGSEGLTPEAEQRLKYELDVIRYTQFANYFLVVWDIMDFVRQRGILSAVRGSAAGSVALYCLGITDIDPMEYGLVFERFLNMERKEMPDIDMDFQDDRRDEVLHYVIERYGSDRVAQIITFGTMGAKAALRDVGRGLGMGYGEVDRIARMVPFKSRTLEDALQANPEFQQAYANEEAVTKLVDNAQGLEGIVHHVSTHAAGVLIADEPLTGTVPLQRPTRGDEESPVMMTQYSMDPVAKLGLLKMDFLGLTNLSILDRAVKLLDQNQGIKIDLNRLPLDDQATFDLLSSGKTTDLFQLESAGMQRNIKLLKPSNLGDIAAMIALYRPGPMEHISSFIDAKHGRIPISYPHESMKELLDETYGIIVYQDQVLHILQRFAGYTLGEADTVRKAMGKKIASLMAQERDRFVAGAQGKGFSEELAIQVFDLIEPFAGYAFNKAHSVSYAMISYWTAFFKAHYPLEYMASVLNSRLDNTDRIVSSINECSKLKIPVLLPDINRSEEFFTIDKDSGATPSLRFGLAAVKTVGEGAIQPIVAERKQNGFFQSIDDFCQRADVSGLNRRTLESLVKAGAFDSLGPRGAFLASLEQIIASAQLATRMRSSGQTSMFDAMSTSSGSTGSGGVAMAGIPLAAPELSGQEKGEQEKEFLGLPLSYNPLFELAGIEDGDCLNSLEQLDEEMQGQTLSLLGHVALITERYTREQKKFLIVNLDLLGGPLEVMVWPDVLDRTQEEWVAGRLVRASGKLRLRGDQLSLACEQVEQYIPKSPSKSKANGKANSQPDEAGAKGQRVATNGTHPPSATLPKGDASSAIGGNTHSLSVHSRIVSLAISESADPVEDAHRLREVIQVLLEYPGKDRVNLQIQTGGKRVLMELPVVSTGYTEELKVRLERLLGFDTVDLLPEPDPERDSVPV